HACTATGGWFCTLPWESSRNVVPSIEKCHEVSWGSSASGERDRCRLQLWMPCIGSGCLCFRANIGVRLYIALAVHRRAEPYLRRWILESMMTTQMRSHVIC